MLTSQTNLITQNKLFSRVLCYIFYVSLSHQAETIRFHLDQITAIEPLLLNIWQKNAWIHDCIASYGATIYLFLESLIQRPNV